MRIGHRKCGEEWTEVQESCDQVNENTKKNGPRYRKVVTRSPEMRRRMDRGAGKLLAGHRKYEKEWTEIQENCSQVIGNKKKSRPKRKKVIIRSL